MCSIVVSLFGHRMETSLMGGHARVMTGAPRRWRGQLLSTGHTTVTAMCSYISLTAAAANILTMGFLGCTQQSSGRPMRG